VIKEKKIPLQRILLLTVATAALVYSCTKDPGYDFPEDPALHRKDSITLTLINEINTDSLKSTVQWLQSMGTRFAFADNNREVAVKIRDRFKRIGYDDVALDSFWVSTMWQFKIYENWQYNVICHLQGSVHPDSLLILGAHYDNILDDGDPFELVPGADDNGSGVAAAIEIARVMKLKDYKPAISIRFVAFAAEEVGLLGSTDFVAKTAWSGRPVRLMINNDMIAYAQYSNRLFWTVNIMNYSNSAELRSEAVTLCKKYTGLTPLNDNTNNKRSDSYPFFLKDYQALYFAAGDLDPNYHTTDDLVSYCNFNYCGEVVRLSCAMLVYSN
jgi:leucyl aminopeptidase